jgi:hypothetical protein
MSCCRRGNRRVGHCRHRAAGSGGGRGSRRGKQTRQRRLLLLTARRALDGGVRPREMLGRNDAGFFRRSSAAARVHSRSGGSAGCAVGDGPDDVLLLQLIHCNSIM